MIKTHMDEPIDPPPHNPMNHPEEQPAGIDREFRLGRLLLVLAGAVAFIALLTLGVSAYFSVL